MLFYGGKGAINVMNDSLLDGGNGDDFIQVYGASPLNAFGGDVNDVILLGIIGSGVSPNPGTLPPGTGGGGSGNTYSSVGNNVVRSRGRK